MPSFTRSGPMLAVARRAAARRARPRAGSAAAPDARTSWPSRRSAAGGQGAGPRQSSVTGCPVCRVPAGRCRPPGLNADTRRLAGQPEPPRPLGRDGDADPWPGHVAGGARRPNDSSRTGDAASSRSTPFCAPARPRHVASRAGPRASSAVRPRGGRRRARATRPVDDLAGPQQHRGGRRRRSADDVRAPVHAVGEVAVEAPGRPEHHLRARGAARGRRARPGPRPLVGLHLGDPGPHQPAVQFAGQQRAQQGRGGRLRAAGQPLPHGLRRPQSIAAVGQFGLGPLACSATRTGAAPP